jgi:hypothetical protein
MNKLVEFEGFEFIIKTYECLQNLFVITSSQCVLMWCIIECIFFYVPVLYVIGIMAFFFQMARQPLWDLGSLIFFEAL